MQKIRIGSQMYVIKDGRSETEMKALIAKASKIKSPKQQRAAMNAVKCGRNYPKFKEGDSVKQYVEKYYDANFGIGLGRFSDERTLRGQAEAAVRDFFQPLSITPQYAQSGEVIEEVMA